MIESNEPIYSVDLPDGLTLRSVATNGQLQRVAAFNGLIHGQGVTGMTANLFAAHPDTRGRDLLYVENDAGEVIASACLIPWTLHYSGVSGAAASRSRGAPPTSTASTVTNMPTCRWKAAGGFSPTRCRRPSAKATASTRPPPRKPLCWQPCMNRR